MPCHQTHYSFMVRYKLFVLPFIVFILFMIGCDPAGYKKVVLVPHPMTDARNLSWDSVFTVIMTIAEKNGFERFYYGQKDEKCYAKAKRYICSTVKNDELWLILSHAPGSSV